MKTIFLFVLVFVFAIAAISPVYAQDLSVSSPDGKLNLKVDLKEKIYYSLYFEDELVIYPSPVSVTVNEGLILGKNAKLISSNKRSVNEEIATVWGRRKIVQDVFNELNLKFNDNFGIIFRMYDDGLAYRFTLNMKGQVKITDEEATFRFTDNHNALLAITGNLQTSFEQVHQWVPILEMTEEKYATLPAIIDFKGKIKLSITDADVRDYPAMNIYKPGQNGRPWLKALFAAYPAKTEQGGWGLFNMRVTARENYIALTSGTRSLPWRVVVVAENDAMLAENDIVYKLSSPLEIDASWVKPGKSAWEWWNDWNLEGVDFKTGVNNQTYKYYIDFASENGLDYVIMDEGWSDQFDITLPVPGLDVPALAKYAAEKNVRLILWAVWHTMDNQMEKAMDMFQTWGIAGIKVDFIDRDDQLAINFMERCVKEGAKRKLLVDFHGCPRPLGLSRAYPNLINYEGVVGNEYNKGNWNGVFPTPVHNVTIPFTRMMSGPMDYTPGAMRNSTQTSFGFSNSTPMSRGTRCHQLGMFIVYDAPLQMLCDAPTEYLKYPDILSYLSDVPVTWDDTKVLEGKIGEYIVSLRQKDNNWYIGGLSNWTERNIEIDLSFLSEGKYSAEIFQDGVNAHKLAEDYSHIEKQIDKNSKLNVTMAPGGGFAIVLRKI